MHIYWCCSSIDSLRGFHAVLTRLHWNESGLQDHSLWMGEVRSRVDWIVESFLSVFAIRASCRMNQHRSWMGISPWPDGRMRTQLGKIHQNISHDWSVNDHLDEKQFLFSGKRLPIYRPEVHVLTTRVQARLTRLNWNSNDFFLDSSFRSSRSRLLIYSTQPNFFFFFFFFSSSADLYCRHVGFH